MKNLKYTMPIAMALALALAVPVVGGENGGGHNKYTAILSHSTSAEMPAKAAELVSQADAKHLKETTIEVVKAAMGLNPAAAATIVGAIAQAEPSMAATAAATAVSLVPHMAAAIARAAAAVSPTQVGAVVEAVCRVVPAAYPNVATAVSQVAPGDAKEILAAIEAAIPELKDSINQALATYNGNLPSVTTLINGLPASATPALASVSPPFTLASAPRPIILLPEGPGGGGGGTPVNTNPAVDPTNAPGEPNMGQ